MRHVISHQDSVQEIIHTRKSDFILQECLCSAINKKKKLNTSKTCIK